MGVEFELKYQALPAALARIRQEIPGAEHLYEMQTTYYDTPDGDFSARHCTLRRRTENASSICTLKAPTDGLGRQEWETECDSIEAATEKLCKLGVPEDLCGLAKKGLLPICGARFTRLAKTLDIQGAVVEVALDQGVLTGGSREEALCEVEVELKSGSQEACVAFAQHLAQQYGLQVQPDSKFCRALALYKGE